MKSFTLVEIIIYIALIGIILVGIIYFSISISNSRNKTYVKQEVQANTRTALNLITQKILSANGVNVNSSSFDLDPGILSLSYDDVNKNPTIISLNKDDGQIIIQEGSTRTDAITTDEVKVTNLTFHNFTSTADRENIGINLTIEYNNNNNDPIFEDSFSFQTAVSLRQ